MRVECCQRTQRRLDLGSFDRRLLTHGRREVLFHETAQVRVFPLLDAPVRKTQGLEHIDRAAPPRANRVATRQPALDSAECFRQALFGLRLHNAHSHLALQPHAAFVNSA